MSDQQQFPHRHATPTLCTVPPLVQSGRSTRRQETHTCTGRKKQHYYIIIIQCFVKATHRMCEFNQTCWGLPGRGICRWGGRSLPGRRLPGQSTVRQKQDESHCDFNATLIKVPALCVLLALSTETHTTWVRIFPTTRLHPAWTLSGGTYGHIPSCTAGCQNTATLFSLSRHSVSLTWGKSGVEFMKLPNKTNWGKSLNLQNENKHWFSMLQISLESSYTFSLTAYKQVLSLVNQSEQKMGKENPRLSSRHRLNVKVLCDN